MDITYNINNPRALNLGYQYDHNVRTVTFTGFTPVDDSNTVYLKFEGLGLYPLSNMAFDVSQSFTLSSGTFQGQLFELAADDTLVQNSCLFDMMIKPSLDEDEEIVAEDASISLWFTEMSELYNTVLAAYEEGTLVTAENVTAALGYTPADASAIPTAVSELTNDSGYISGITASDVTTALTYTPADENDLPTVVSDLTNDAGYITGITSSDISEALGYVPADANNVVVTITAEDVEEALGYVPANEDDIPTVPTVVSAFTNDTGYISEITSSDVVEALGYTPADASSVVITITAEDVEDALGYVPADESDIPTAVSALTNDAGYISEVTSEDVLEALGYTPADANLGDYESINTVTLSSASSSVTISTDSEGDSFGLDGAVVVIANNSGIGGGSNAYLYAYDANDNVIGGSRVFFYGGSSVINSVIEIERRGDVVEMFSIGYTSSAPYTPVNKSLILSDDSSGKIAKIEIDSNGSTFTSGTAITLLGYTLESTDVSGEYELVKTISMSSSASSVVVTTGDDNNTLDLTGFVVTMSNDSGIGGGSNGYIYAYDDDDNVVGSQVFFAGGSSIMRVAVEVEIRGDVVEMTSIGWNSSSPYAPTNKSTMGTLGSAGNITKIEISGNGYSINSGTTINIYGV